MKLSELQATWETDCVIDPVDIAGESIRTPKLHSKYIRWHSDAKVLLRKVESALIELRAVKYKYYRGEMTQEELKVRGWDQFQKRILKGEVEQYVSSDPEVISLSTKVEYVRTIIQFLESVLKSIMSRSFDIKNHIEWLKFTQGEL